MRRLSPLLLVVLACSGRQADLGESLPELGTPEPDHRVAQIDSQYSLACAVTTSGKARCWGESVALGQLGVERAGLDEPLYEVPFLDLGGVVESVSVGAFVACAILEGGALRCWGDDGNAGLGLALFGVNEVGFETEITSVPAIDLAGPVQKVIVEWDRTCALREDGALFCWGESDTLGYAFELGSGTVVGRSISPLQAGPLSFQEPVRDFALNLETACAVLESGEVKCWGPSNAPIGGYVGQGVNLPLSEAPALELVEPAVAVMGAHSVMCASLESGRFQCWGNQESELWGPGIRSVGLPEGQISIADSPVFDLGSPIERLFNAPDTIIVKTAAGDLWGWGCLDQGDSAAAFGLPGVVDQGCNPLVNGTPERGPADFGAPLVDISARGRVNGFAIVGNGELIGWGANENGLLGYGHRDAVGDDEAPREAGIVVW